MVRNATNLKKISALSHYVHILKIMHAVLYNPLLFHKHGVILTFKEKDCSDLFADCSIFVLNAQLLCPTDQTMTFVHIWLFSVKSSLHCLEVY